MYKLWLYSLISVFLVSLISLIGILTLAIKANKLKKILLYFVSFSTGALFGDAFIHLLPSIIKKVGFGLNISLYIILGIAIFFILEKIIQWHHHHLPHKKRHLHPSSITILFADGIHNFIDGLIIGTSYLVSIPVGIATALAVILHEIPQEIGDFGLLLYGGFSKRKALFFNFLTALTAILGAIVSLLISSYIENITILLIPIAAGGFIYIAGSDLIPELHKEIQIKKSLLQFTMFISGILIMLALLLLE